MHVGTEASPTFTLSNFDRTALMETCCTEHARNEKFHYIVCKACFSINVRLMSSHVPKFLWIRQKSLVHSLCMLSSNKSLNFFQMKIPTTDHVDDDEGSQLLRSLQKSFKHLFINAIWHTIDTFEVHLPLQTKQSRLLPSNHGLRLVNSGTNMAIASLNNAFS